MNGEHPVAVALREWGQRYREESRLLEGLTPEQEFGQQVRRLREAEGITQLQLTERMGRFGIDLHQSAIAKIELGTRMVRFNEVVAINRVFGYELQAVRHD